MTVSSSAAVRSGARVRALAIGSIFGGMAAAASLAAQSPAATDTAAGGGPLTYPPVLRNLSSQPGTVEVELTARVVRLELRPGVETEVFSYNGSVPGPTLEAREGDRVVVRFRNELPEPTTVHWHGLHLPADADGSPLHPVAPGEEYAYEFTLKPGSAGTYWYHPHPHHRTGYQVGKGLAGAVVVRDPEDPLPGSIEEKLLILTDNRFRPDGSIDFAEAGTRQARVDAENGREGDVLFVNGQVMPTLAIRSGEVQRWRVLNLSSARVYRLALQGHSFLHVGSDGGLFERPREAEEILLAVSERAELLVRGTGAPGSRALLEDLPYDRYLPQTRPPDWGGKRPLLTLLYSEEVPIPAERKAEIPETLRPIPPLDPADATEFRRVTFTKNRINGRQMDMGRVDEVAALGATEVWEIENLVGMDHPFHLHGFRFQVIERHGEPEPFRSWEDTVNVPKRSTVRLVVRFDDYPGKWMFHCHILQHEDAGMMGVLEVR